MMLIVKEDRFTMNLCGKLHAWSLNPVMTDKFTSFF